MGLPKLPIPDTAEYFFFSLALGQSSDDSCQRLALSPGRIYDAQGREAEAEIRVYGSESMGFPDRQSFYHILARMLPLRGQHSVAVSLSEFSKAQGKAEQRYGVIDANSQAMSNARIIDALYHPDPAFEKIRKAIIGDMSKNELKRALGAAASISARNAEDLAPVFMFKSFPETYFHQQIAETLFQSNKLTDPERAQERVAETTRIVTQALGLKIPGQAGGRNPLAYMLAIANSHDERTSRGPYYTADTVEFTLLTFPILERKRLEFARRTGFSFGRSSDRSWACHQTGCIPTSSRPNLACTFTARPARALRRSTRRFY